MNSTDQEGGAFLDKLKNAANSASRFLKAQPPPSGMATSAPLVSQEPQQAIGQPYAALPPMSTQTNPPPDSNPDNVIDTRGKPASEYIGKANNALFAINAVFGAACVLMLVVLLPFAIHDVVRFYGMQKKEFKAIQDGDRILIQDSLAFKVLSYAHVESGNEPFYVYMPITVSKVVFNITMASITIAMYLFAFQLYFMIEKEDIGIDSKRILEGIVMVMYTSLGLLTFLKWIYVKLFQTNLLEKIREKYRLLKEIDDDIYAKMSTSPTFYADLQAGNIKSIAAYIPKQTEDEAIRMLTTINLYEYYKGIVADFESSDIKKLFTQNGVTERKIRPSYFLRLDCAHHIKNLYHVLEIKWSASEPNSTTTALDSLTVETQISNKMQQLNMTIAKVKLETQPLVDMFGNYLKTVMSYQLFLSFFAILIVSFMYGFTGVLKDTFVSVFNVVKGWFVKR